MSLHADAVKVLAGWPPPDGQQRALRDLYLDHLREYPDAMSRACRPGHVTASTAVLDAAAGNVLLTLHRKIGRWLQLGGHCEPGDPGIAAAALREAAEESGITGLAMLGGPARLDRHEVRCAMPPAAALAAADEARTWHLDVQFAAIAPPRARAVRSAESAAVRWWPVDALPPSADDSLRCLVAQALRRARRPRC